MDKIIEIIKSGFNYFNDNQHKKSQKYQKDLLLFLCEIIRSCQEDVTKQIIQLIVEVF